MPKTPPQFNLTLEEAIPALDAQAEKNQSQTERGLLTEQLKDIPNESCYDIGYATCLADLKSITGPDPREIFIVEVPINRPEEEKNDA